MWEPADADAWKADEPPVWDEAFAGPEYFLNLDPPQVDGDYPQSRDGYPEDDFNI